MLDPNLLSFIAAHGVTTKIVDAIAVPEVSRGGVNHAGPVISTQYFLGFHRHARSPAKLPSVWATCA